MPLLFCPAGRIQVVIITLLDLLGRQHVEKAGEKYSRSNLNEWLGSVMIFIPSWWLSLFTNIRASLHKNAYENLGWAVVFPSSTYMESFWEKNHSTRRVERKRYILLNDRIQICRGESDESGVNYFRTVVLCLCLFYLFWTSCLCICPRVQFDMHLVGILIALAGRCDASIMMAWVYFGFVRQPTARRPVGNDWTLLLSFRELFRPVFWLPKCCQHADSSQYQ